jgi:hypothetical protein
MFLILHCCCPLVLVCNEDFSVGVSNAVGARQLLSAGSRLRRGPTIRLKH